jgi:hypothetical protein
MTNWENDPTVKKIRKLAKIQVENGIDHAVWSMDIKPWNKVAYTCKIRLHDSNPYWGDKMYIPLENPTWMDLWKACDVSIRESGDTDHCFVEGFRKKGDVVEVFFGS